MRIQDTIDLLGKKAKDKITGREGIITSVSFDLYGCVQAVLAPPQKADGSLHNDTHWHDVSRLDITDHNRAMEVPAFEVVAPPSPRAEVSGCESGKPVP